MDSITLTEEGWGEKSRPSPDSITGAGSLAVRRRSLSVLAYYETRDGQPERKREWRRERMGQRQRVRGAE